MKYEQDTYSKHLTGGVGVGGERVSPCDRLIATITVNNTSNIVYTTQP